ncbi:MAG: isoprenylcysteine carboxylmethyltransferase family protein, partial [Burkholderiaceae bacterium]|nr:isoprenylcysteine carboxylmethyltransferase family protein [Burkholderiaceae bacterium]
AFAGYIQRFQIRPEERALEAKFGAEYVDYKRRVRRWL